MLRKPIAMITEFYAAMHPTRRALPKMSPIDART